MRPVFFVADDSNRLVPAFQRLYVGLSDQGAGRIFMRENNFRVGDQDLDGLGHEANPSEDDSIRFLLGGEHGQVKGIPYSVGQGLDFRGRIIMC